ncbi:hypothetical protein [Gymnodinialimonas ulvae]|uniref:hypothetical protein n=1 Tax=Gymnodinialimonas ulvae TaxID=3126504 RepID=UPI0030A74DF5
MTRATMILTAMALLALAACGADGEPERPTRAEMPAMATGVSVSGTVSVGVSGSF